MFGATQQVMSSRSSENPSEVWEKRRWSPGDCLSNAAVRWLPWLLGPAGAGLDEDSTDEPVESRTVGGYRFDPLGLLTHQCG